MAAKQSLGETDPPLLTLSLTPMLKSLTPIMKLQLKLCNLLSTVPFEWDHSTNRLRLLKSLNLMRLCKLQIFLHCFYTTIMVLYFLSPQNLTTASISTRMVGLAFLVCFGATMLMRLTIWNHKRDVVKLVNSFFQFETKYLPNVDPCNKGKVKADKVSKAIMTLGLMTTMGMPGLMMTILLVSPCRPPHLGYILFKKGEMCYPPIWPVRLVMLAFDTWMWFSSISSAVYAGFQVFFPGLKCFTFYILLITRILRPPKDGSYDGPKDGSYDGPKFRHISLRDRFCFKVYDHIRLLAKLYNFCLQMAFVPTQLTAACIVLIIGLYTMIKLHQEIPMPGFAFFPLLASDGLAMIFISQVAAQVYTGSQAFIQIARRSETYKRKAWFPKMARATTMIKIRFGSQNFIDQMSPLIYLNFCLTQTVQLVLLS